MNEIIRITGSKDSVSQTCRLEGFKGTKDEIILNSNNGEQFGINALLCADDSTRMSYFLDDEQNELLARDEKLSSDGLDFFSTDFRFDDYRNYKKHFANNQGEKELVVFTHEWIFTVHPRKNIFKYIEQVYRRYMVKRNIDSFMKSCRLDGYIFVSELGGKNAI